MRRRLTGTVCILLVLTLLCAGASASAEPPVQQITAPGLPVGAAPAGLPSMPETLEEDTWAQAMVLREVMSLNDDGEVGNVTVFDYTSAPDNYSFLDSWDRPLRSIEVVWETYSGSERQLRRENILVPTDWEYLPFECRWGDFTAYNNDLAIGEYRYPGDGAGYLLFLTSVKG